MDALLADSPRLSTISSAVIGAELAREIVAKKEKKEETHIGACTLSASAVYVLATSPGLLDLFLITCGISRHHLVVLADTIKPELRCLFLSDNVSIGGAGAMIIAPVLQKSALERLYLDNCGIDNAGAAAISRALRGNTTLRELGLARNPITDAGAVALASCLGRVSTLFLCRCPLTDVGVTALCARLYSMPFDTSRNNVCICHSLATDAAIKRLANAYRFGWQQRRLLTFESARLVKNNSALTRFLNRDGDDALGHKIAEFLITDF